MADEKLFIDYMFYMFVELWKVIKQFWFLSVPVLIWLICLVIGLILSLMGRNGG